MVLISWIMISVEQIQDCNFHLALIQVCRLVLHDFDGTDRMCSHVLALDNLSECTLAEHIEDEISITTMLST